MFYERGSLFRGSVKAVSGVTYGAYGKGEKPRLYGSEMNFADPQLWILQDPARHIWKCRNKVLDVGTLVFDDRSNSRKLIPSYKNGKFVCREDEERPFTVEQEMTEDLDLFWEFDRVLTSKPSRGEDFPVPDVWNGGFGERYLRCDRGNPGAVFSETEALSAVNMFTVSDKANVTIDNLCVKYVGRHGVSAAGHCVGLHVTNCEFGWIGGVIQTYEGTDPNYPEGGRGTVTRYGNAVEVYGGCEDYRVCGNYIYQVYDAAINHQVTTNKKVIMENIVYSGNLIENCVYGIEYFLDQIDGEQESYMDKVMIRDNFIRRTGFGWGQQRHNRDTPAAIKGWNYTNPARNFLMERKIFDRSAYRLLHLVAYRDAYCPVLKENTYIQATDGILGEYGGNWRKQPEQLPFGEAAVRTVFADRDAVVITL